MRKIYCLVPFMLFMCTFVLGQTIIWQEPVMQGVGSVTFGNTKTVDFGVTLGADIPAGDVNFIVYRTFGYENIGQFTKVNDDTNAIGYKYVKH